MKPGEEVETCDQTTFPASDLSSSLTHASYFTPPPPIPVPCTEGRPFCSNSPSTCACCTYNQLNPSLLFPFQESSIHYSLSKTPVSPSIQQPFTHPRKDISTFTLSSANRLPMNTMLIETPSSCTTSSLHPTPNPPLHHAVFSSQKGHFHIYVTLSLPTAS